MQRNQSVSLSTIVSIVVVAIVFFCAGYSIRPDRFVAAEPAPLPTRDGNPVGYDLVGRISLSSIINAAQSCSPSPSKTCQFELHYVGKTSSSTISLSPPTCSTTQVYCVTFTSSNTPMQLHTVDETGASHPMTGFENLTITGGTLVWGP